MNTIVNYNNSQHVLDYYKYLHMFDYMMIVQQRN